MELNNKKEWIKSSRKLMPKNNLTPCFVCGGYKEITQAHHVYPLGKQHDDGLTIPVNDYVWLCPNHHVLVHQVIKRNSYIMVNRFKTHDEFIKTRGYADLFLAYRDREKNDN